MMPDNLETGIPVWAFAAGAVAVIAAAFAAVWFMFPAPDTRHDLVAPSGNARIELGELCGDGGCNRVAILDVGGVRTGCPLALSGNRPLFGDVTAQWSADEASVVVAYAAVDGSTGTLTIARADCTLTQ
jgi:hypothetical protein